MFDFPASPANGTEYQTPNGLTFVYNGYAWIMKTGPWGSYGVALVDSGPGITVTPDPIVDVGTVELTVPVAVALGGTGALNAPGARTNLGAVYVAGDTMTGDLNVDATLRIRTQVQIDNGGPSGAGRLRFANGSSNLSIFDDTNSHIEASTALWINGNTQAPVTVGGPLQVNGAFTLGSTITMPNATYIRWRNTDDAPIDLLTLWSDNRFYVGSYGSNILILRGGSIEMKGNVVGDGEISATTALRCNANPNAIITYVQRDNYGITWGFYAYGNTARWWNSTYGDRISLDLSGTCYFTNNTVLPNNCSYYVKAADGNPYPVIGTDSGNRTYVGHPSLYTSIRGVNVTFDSAISGNFTATGEVKGTGSIATNGYLWVNGAQFSVGGDGWLYCGASYRCWDFQSSNNIDAAGHIYVGGLDIYNSGGWLYTTTHFRAAGHIQTDGDLYAAGIIRTGGLYWQNNGGWMYSPWSVWSAQNVQAENDILSGGVFRRHVSHRGARIENAGWDWDWNSFFMSGTYLYATPDYSTGYYYAPAGPWSDVRLKTNIRNSEIDALGLIKATPVRAFEWNEEGRKLTPLGPPEIDIGIVAQELQENIPVAVQVSAWEHASLFIDMNKLTPYLFRAVQQLAEMNAKLEARIAELEAR